MREIYCSKCKKYLGKLENGNVVTTKYECELTGKAIGRFSEAYIKCKCGHREEFIY